MKIKNPPDQVAPNKLTTPCGNVLTTALGVGMPIPLNENFTNKGIIQWLSVWLSLATLTFLTPIILLPTFAEASINPFPTYKSIEHNVEFWKKVYAEYPSNMGMIHDSDNLAVIYEVISVKLSSERGSRRSNKKKIKQVKNKYKKILNKLAAQKKPFSTEEKRVAALFGQKGSVKVWKNAADNIRFQRCLSDRFKDGLIRSGQYMAEIKSIFRKNGLPVDLAYLPHVESSFNYKAYSKFGAAGIWQFIRSTGRRFLKVSYTLDERRDPITASHAAAKYLKENYGKLNSWPLALTAYNHGAGSMLKAQRKLGDYENIFNNYDHKRFGFASRNFYSEFLAAREIAKDYRSYFKNLSLDKPVQVKKVLMKGYAPIDELSKHFNVDIETIQNFNPALRKPVYSGQKYIPKGYSVKFPSNLNNFDKLAQNIPGKLYKADQKRSRFYRVERGDTAGKIARINKVSLKDLIDINMLNRRATIYIGQNLRIPAPGEKILLAQASNKNRQQSKTSTVTKTKITAPANKKPTPPIPKVALAPPSKTQNQLAKVEINAAQPSQPITDEPKPTVSAPAAQPKEAPLQVADASSVIQTATIPTTTETEATDTVPLSVTASTPTPIHQKMPTKDIPIPEIRTYQAPPVVVEEIVAIDPPTSSVTEINPAVIFGNFKIERVSEIKGQEIGFVQVEDMETLGHYADWLEIPTQRIRELNGFSFNRHIRTHQQIKIPLGKVTKNLFEERRYEHHKEVEEDFFSAYAVVGIQAYSIKSGDNIWTLCRDELELPFWLVKKYNPVLNFDSLMPKQQLTVPVVEKTS